MNTAMFQGEMGPGRGFMRSARVGFPENLF